MKQKTSRKNVARAVQAPLVAAPIAAPPVPVPPPQLVQAPKPVKLDLACGQLPTAGFEGVDLWWEGAQHRVDLWKFPWPWADSSVDELHCSHHIEHIPAREVGEPDLSPNAVCLRCGATRGSGAGPARVSCHGNPSHLWDHVGRDMFFAFFDEAWRVLKPGSKFTVVCPAAPGDRAFQDPTHRRFIVRETFFYLAKEFREANKLTHGPYAMKCNFSGNIGHTIPTEESARAPEVAAERFRTLRNVVYDWHATLTVVK